MGVKKIGIGYTLDVWNFTPESEYLSDINVVSETNYWHKNNTPLNCKMSLCATANNILKDVILFILRGP